jgi:hypothetical protein
MQPRTVLNLRWTLTPLDELQSSQTCVTGCRRGRQWATTGNPSIRFQSQVNAAKLPGQTGCEHYNANPRFQTGGSGATLTC